jgi:hypothetical protein
MRLIRRARLRTIVFAIVALLLAQWTVASYACPQLAPPDIEAEQTAAAIAMPPDCPGAASKSPGNAARCQQHCTANAKATELPPPVPLPPSAPLVVRADTAPAPAPKQSPLTQVARATAPPFTILYCVSLT